MERIIAAVVSNWGRRCSTGLLLRVLFLAWGLCLTLPLQAEVSYTKSGRFRIPFEFNADEIARLRVREVQLYVSTDRGQNWQLAGTAAPQQGYIPFEATQEGEHWFSVKTRSEEGAVLPKGAHQSSLEVVVDATPPKLLLQLDQAEPGRVRLNWEAEDIGLDAESLVLEFLDSRSAQWTSVGVRAAANGQTTWGVERGGEVMVRARILDLAGNEQRAEAATTISPVNNRPERPDFSRPVAIIPGPSTSSVGANTPASIPYRTTSGRFMPTTNSPPAIQALQDQTRRLTPPPVESAISPVITSPAISGLDLPGPGLPAPDRNTSDANRPVLGSSSPSIGSPPSIPVPGHAFVPVSQQPPSKVVRQLVNSNQFRIEYNLKSVGPSGVRSVNLYISEDGGRKWWHYDVDADRQSPIDVAVPEDGEFGFAFRVESGAGFVASPPQPGDMPELTIVVDRSPPVVELFPIEQPLAGSHGQVTIRWSAQDRELGERPVALYFSTSQSGPWKLIEGSYPNTGSYPWKLPEQTGGDRFFVRLEVYDLAGNMGAQQTDRPLVLDFAQPALEVIGVQSVAAPRR